MSLAALALLAMAPQQAHQAWVDYALQCQGCHLPDGAGMPGKVPAMRGFLAQFLRVPGGRAYVVQVPGVATSRLSDAQVARLLNWLLREMGPDLPHDFQDYTPEEIARLRAHWLRQPGPVRASLLAQLTPAPQKP